MLATEYYLCNVLTKQSIGFYNVIDTHKFAKAYKRDYIHKNVGDNF